MRIAIAFGHCSGWREVKDALLNSSARKIRILLGQNFYQTEPELLKQLEQLPQPKWETRLATNDQTFHPKVWIVRSRMRSFCVVGSGNLSEGGLCRNVECGIYTNEIASFEKWFDEIWDDTELLSRTLPSYTQGYKKVSAARRALKKKIEQVNREQTWNLGEALKEAKTFWKSSEGKRKVKAWSDAISKMRECLDYPEFKFDADAWRKFLNIPEFGNIRQGYNEDHLQNLKKIRYYLRQTHSSHSAEALAPLLKIRGIGPNTATKLLVVCHPKQFIAIAEKGPVVAALRQFGLSLPKGPIRLEEYRQLLRDLRPLESLAEKFGFDAAPALDAFLYSRGQ